MQGRPTVNGVIPYLGITYAGKKEGEGVRNVVKFAPGIDALDLKRPSPGLVW